MLVRFFIFFALLMAFIPSLGWAEDEDAPRAPKRDISGTADSVRLSPQAEKDKSLVEAATIKRLRAEGRQSYRQGAYERAIRKFEAVYRLSGDPNVLYELALTYHVLRDWDQCVDFMGRYLKQAPIGPKRDRALNTLQSCEARRTISQTILIESDPSGADVYLGNRNTPIQGQTPFRAKVSTGVKRVWLELKGYEREIKDIEVRHSEPMRLYVILRKRVDKGWLYIDSDVRNAQIYVDGKPLQITPLLKPVPVSVGDHQIQLRREGFEPFEAHVRVEQFLMTRVDAPLGRSSHVSTWRSSLGWTGASLGVLAMVGGALATHYANEQYNDTTQFDEFVTYERMGYVGGVSLVVTGISLLVWDSLRDHVLTSDRNTLYGKPMETPDPAELGLPSLMRRRQP
jgi:hypothetical protein